MTLVDKKLSAKTATSSTTGGEIHIILPSGGTYVSRRITDANIIKAHNADRTVKTVFENSDLTAGVLTVTHGKVTQDVDFTLFTPANVNYNASVTFTIIDDNNVSIDFGGEIEAGSWTLNLRCYQ